MGSILIIYIFMENKIFHSFQILQSSPLMIYFHLYNGYFLPIFPYFICCVLHFFLTRLPVDMSILLFFPKISNVLIHLLVLPFLLFPTVLISSITFIISFLMLSFGLLYDFSVFLSWELNVCISIIFYKY